MGGGSKVQQTNPAQAAAANAGATGAANTGTALSGQYNQQQQQQYNNLFGSDGKSGAVGSLLNPSSLNPTSPTGSYALQNTAANTTAAQQYAANKAAITSGAQQSGFGPNTPSGFVAQQQNQNANALADTKGTNYLAATQAQLANNTSNFWNAANMSQAQGTAAQGGALAGNNTAAQTYGNLYGTAGKGDVTQNSNLLGNVISAGGTVGAAAVCVAIGTLIRLNDCVVAKVEDLHEGDQVMGVEGRIPICNFPEPVESPLLRLVAENGFELECSPSHTLLRPRGGYVRACDALLEEVRIHNMTAPFPATTHEGKTRIVAVESIGTGQVVKLELRGSHTYISNGFYSEE